jgi:hypothetical protein
MSEKKRRDVLFVTGKMITKISYQIILQSKSTLMPAEHSVMMKSKPEDGLTLWDPWGMFFIHLTHESGISNYKDMNLGGMNLR